MYGFHRKRAARTAMHAALAGVFSLTAPVALAAGTPMQSEHRHAPAERSAGDIDYRVGGIGEREAEAMRALSSDYPLTLTFVERAADGRDMYTADVDVSIADSSGNTALDIQAPGPLLLADLPDGRYTVEATLDGDTKSQQVEIDGGDGERVVFVWPEQSPQQVSRADR